jgi:hypothetical protein
VSPRRSRTIFPPVRLCDWRFLLFAATLTARWYAILCPRCRTLRTCLCNPPQTICDSVSEAGEGRREGRARRRRMSEGQGDSERLQASAFSVCASSGDLGDRRCRFSGPVTCKLHRCITWRCESLYSKLGIQARSQTRSLPYCHTCNLTHAKAFLSGLDAVHQVLESGLSDMICENICSVAAPRCTPRHRYAGALCPAPKTRRYENVPAFLYRPAGLPLTL